MIAASREGWGGITQRKQLGWLIIFATRLNKSEKLQNTKLCYATLLIDPLLTRMSHFNGENKQKQKTKGSDQQIFDRLVRALYDEVR
jgi:hypothetical protein